MWISDPRPEPPPPSGRRALAAAALVAGFALVAEAASVRTGVSIAPHPAWIAVMVLGARYGSGGFLAGVAAAAVGVGLGSALCGSDPFATWTGTRGGPDLVALGASLGISWVASSHLRREADLRERIGLLADRAGSAETEALELRGLVEGLRLRADRTSASLGFLRDAARRLEGGEPRAAAEAAADLALVRTGASVVTVETDEGRAGLRLAIRSSGDPGELALPRTEVPRHVEPIRSAGDRVGVIALWGLPARGLDQAAVHDLEVIAAWCAPAVVAARASSSPVAVGDTTEVS
jgi:hypothetical protein